jgi:protein-disulfide isomerase
VSPRADQKERLRSARRAQEASAERRQRRQRLVWLLGAAAAALIVVGIGIAISQSGGSDSSDASADTAAVEKEFAGIPQDGAVLGRTDAPATLIEYGDLQCPACKAYATETLPDVLDRFVRPGRVKLELRLISIIGPESQLASETAAATSFQDRMWQFTDLFYRNQGIENSGYVDQQFLEDIANATPGLDTQRALDQASSPRAAALAARWVAQANRAGVDSTPSFFLVKDGQTPQEVPFTADLPSTVGERLAGE